MFLIARIARGIIRIFFVITLMMMVNHVFFDPHNRILVLLLAAAQVSLSDCLL